MRVAVVTPYIDEPDAVLRAAHYSVRAQTCEVTHIMVADGARRRELDAYDIEHIVLGHPHMDGGCTARAVGALAAFAAGHDAVAFLDADNRYTPDHVASLVEVVESTGAALVFSDRSIELTDGTQCRFEDRDVVERQHVDTSCHFMTSRAAFLIAVWASMGPELWPLCDRLVVAAARRRDIPIGWSNRRSLIYVSRWGLHYKAMGQPIPRDEHQLDWTKVRERAMSHAESSPWITSEDIMAVLGSEHGEVDPADDQFWNRLVAIDAPRGA